MLSLLVTLWVNAAPFPLPAVDGKAPAVTEKQKSFRLPMKFERVRAFYDEQFAKEKDVSLKVTGAPPARVLTLATRRKGDRWTRATAREGELETVIEVTPVIEGAETAIEGTGTPLVQFVFQRSAEVGKAVEQTQDPLLK